MGKIELIDTGRLTEKQTRLNMEKCAEFLARMIQKYGDVVTALILKYGPAIKRKWILRDWIKNIQADCFWRSLACKRYQRYFDCMKAIVKNDAT